MSRRNKYLWVGFAGFALVSTGISVLLDTFPLLGLALFLTLLFGFVFMSYRRLNVYHFAPIFAFSLVWFVVDVVPIYYGYLTDSINFFALEAGPDLWLKGLTIEMVFILFWYLGYFLHNKRILSFIGRLKVDADKKLDLKTAHILLVVSIISFLLKVKLGPIGYGAVQAKTLSDWSTKSVTLLHFFSTPATFFLPSVIIFIFEVDVNRIFKSTLFGLFLLYFLIALLRGTRAPLLAPIFMLSIYSIIHGFRLTKSYKYALIGILVVLLSSGILENYRSSTIRVRNLKELFEVGKEELFSRQIDKGVLIQNLDSFVYRLDAVQTGGLFAEYADSTEKVGLKPYVGLLYLWIPRYFAPNKPMVGSCDGTPLGEPPFIAAYLRGGFIGNSTSVSPSSIMYWQFGWLGLTVGGLLCGFLVAVISILLLRSGLLGKILFLHFLFLTNGFTVDLCNLLRWIILYLIPICIGLRFTYLIRISRKGVFTWS